MNEKKSTGLNRKSTDKYYTKKGVAESCIGEVLKNIEISKKDDLVIEPSAGDGSFIGNIKKICSNYRFYDLHPENKEIDQLDYLDFEYAGKFKKIHVMGNPPFGRQASLAIKFIKKSAEFCDTVSFILPKSFKKDSMKKHFPLHFHLVFEEDLKENSFSIEGKDYSVPCVFQIWEKREAARAIKEKLTPCNFRFVKKSETPDISFRRVGVNAGVIDTNISIKSPESHYFIKFEKIEIGEKLYDKLRNLNFLCSSYTVGPKSISKEELIKEFNPLLQRE